MPSVARSGSTCRRGVSLGGSRRAALGRTVLLSVVAVLASGNVSPAASGGPTTAPSTKAGAPPMTAAPRAQGSHPSSNGEAQKRPNAIVADALSAGGAATSVRVIASAAGGGSSIAFNLELLRGTGGEGSVREDGLSFEAVRIDATAYVEGSDAFWNHFAGTAAATLFRGRWVQGSATTGWFASLSRDLEMRSLIVGALATRGPLTLGTMSTIAGQPAIAVNDRTDGETLYVAATGTPYPVEIKAKGSLIRFESWDAPIRLTSPSASVEFSTLPSPQPQQVPGEGVSVVLPIGWKVKTIPLGVNSAVKFLALAPKGIGFNANLNLVVAPLPAGASLRGALFSGASAAYKYVGTARSVTINGVPGLEYRSTKAVEVGGEALLTNAWGFIVNGQLFDFTYTALASDSAEYDPIFSASAKTIVFSASAGTTTA